MSGPYQPKTALARIINEIEETAIALLLGSMTIITFINVVLRYGFNTGLIWGLEATTFLFAWLVLFGISYGVKVTSHLGVDAVINVVPKPVRYVMGLMAASVCLAYAFLLLKGSWDYWANFANLPQTTGRWFPTGFEEMTRTSYRAWYEVVDIHMPGFLRFFEDWLNEGEEYEKLPRFIPYFILPVGALLLLLRFVQATIRLIKGETYSLIASHEVEEAVRDSSTQKSEE